MLTRDLFQHSWGWVKTQNLNNRSQVASMFTHDELAGVGEKHGVHEEWAYSAACQVYTYISASS